MQGTGSGAILLEGVQRQEEALVRQEGRAFQVEETACAKAQGRKDQRTAGHWISLELEMCDEVGRGRGCRL